jgi:hypothetical protein
MGTGQIEGIGQTAVASQTPATKAARFGKQPLHRREKTQEHRQECLCHTV